MKQAPDMEQAIDILKRSSLEVELAAKEKEIAQLVEEVQKLQSMVNKMREHNSTATARLEEALETKSRAFSLLEEKLRTQDDYDELKRELSILKSIEFAGNEKEEDAKSKSLEMLLLEKNKALQAENTHLKVAKTELSERYGRLEAQYQEAFTAITEQKQLIAQLEEDLRSVNALSSMFRGDAEGEAGVPVPVEMVADAVKDVQQGAPGTPALMAGIPSDNLKAAAGSLLPIVQSQRERYRLRAQELEAQNVAQTQQVQLIQNELDKLRSDNLKLYEKIKFLQSYPSKAGESSVEVESRYSSQYEAKLDPFSSFSKKEKQKRYMNLKP